MIWDDVVFYLPLDGASITDVMGNIVTQEGTITLGTAWAAPLTGNTTSAFFDGYDTPGPALVFSSNANLNAIGTGDFCFSTWFRGSDITALQTLLTIGTDALDIFVYQEGVSVVTGSIGYVIDARYTMTADTDHFIEVSRVSGVTRYFLDGVLQESSSASYSVTESAAQTRIGSYKVGSTVSDNLKSSLDDILFARAGGHTANYSRPSVKMSVILDTSSGGATGTASLPIQISVFQSGERTLPIVINVAGFGSTAMPLPISIVDAALISGESLLSDVVDAATIWTPAITINGDDVSSNIVGEIDIEATEGAARIARFSLAVSGEVLVPDFVGKPVTINIADADGQYQMRLFTGLISSPRIDLATKTISFDCTDDLQNVVGVEWRESLDNLIGGNWSPAVFDQGATNWTYAQDRLSTTPKSLDLSPDGSLRVTKWEANSTTHLAFSEDRIIDGSLSVSLPDRASLINQVDLSFKYRFPRAKLEAVTSNFSYLQNGLSDWIIAGNSYLRRAAVYEAVHAAGGRIEHIIWDEFPSMHVQIQGYPWRLSDDPEIRALYCTGFLATSVFEYTQDAEERYVLTVRSSTSIGAIGQIRSAMNGAMEAKTPDAVAVETNTLLYNVAISKVPPPTMPIIDPGYTTAAAIPATPETDRSAVEKAIETLIDVARTKIYESHRKGTVSASVPLHPLLDLDKTVQISTSALSAIGKVARVRHRMSSDTGVAVSEFDLALCRLNGLGDELEATPTKAPAGISDGRTAPLVGTPSIVFNGLFGQQPSFEMTFPGVDDLERNIHVVDIASEFEVPIVENTFTLFL